MTLGAGIIPTITSMTASDAWVIATASCAAVSCAVLGCFLVLRRLSMLGDAISHAVLPGLVAGLIVTGTRGTVPMLLGAMTVGLLTAVLSAGLTRWGRVHEDAAMGVVFTSLFAVGVILVTWKAAKIDLDPGCVLYGLVEFVPFDRVNVLGLEVPRALAALGAMLAVNLLAVSLFFKELTIVAFDAALATSMGISAALVHYGLMTLVAATTVVSFEAVGSILVVSMLIAPGASAHLLTDRLGRMIWIAAALAVAAAAVGYVLALAWNTSAAGMISVVLGAEFVLAALLAPTHGVLSKAFHRAGLTLRIAREDVLGMVYRWHEATDERRSPARPTPLRVSNITDATLHGPIVRAAVWDLRRRGELAADPRGGLTLTPSGFVAARAIVRSHRLWEGYLAKHLGLPLDHLHEPSHRVEHYITPRIAEGLGAELGDASDPHGREIPR